MPDYPNPYEFAPLENAPHLNRRKWEPTSDGIESWHLDRYCGRLHCVLHPETPLYIHDEGQQRQPRELIRRFSQVGGQPAIAASALKGAVRSIYEIVSDSCLSLLSKEYKAPGSHQRTYGPNMEEFEFRRLHPIYRAAQRVPASYQPCISLEAACPACLLFGMVEDKPEGKPLAGRLAFSDARPASSRPVRLRMPAAGGGPHPWHSPFYFQQAGQGLILGRKLYFHHRDYRETLRLYGDGGRAGLIELDAQQGDFAFHVDFLNLTQEELTYLVYALALEDGVRHHLGYGKSYGLGSVQIVVQRFEMWSAPGHAGTDRFLTWVPSPLPAAKPAAWRDRGREYWLNRPNGRRAYDAFAHILAWPNPSLYKYPTFDWFRRTPGSENVTLAEYQQGVRSKPASGKKLPPQSPDVTVPPAGGRR